MMRHNSSEATRSGNQLPPRRAFRSGRLFWPAAVFLALAGTAGGLWKFAPDAVSGFMNKEAKPTFLTVEVVEQPFVYQVMERGEVESSSNVEVRCEVRSRNQSGVNILEIVPEGTWVHKGDFLVRFDDANLQTERIQQQIVVSTSEASMIESRTDVESAKLALKEYQQGTFRENEELLESQEFVAQENLRRAEEYLRYSERLAERGYISEVQLDADRFALEKARKECSVAEVRLEVLRSFTRQKMLNQLSAAIETAQARLDSRTKTWELDKVRLHEIEDQIAKCSIHAPSDGQVVYANDPSQRSSSGELLIAPGKMVRERQVLIRLPDPAAMRVMVSVHESRISHISPGQRAEITLDAMHSQTLSGTVTHVSEYPLPSTSVYTSHVKHYAVEVQIEAPSTGIRPGMTAAVNIDVQRIDSAVQVPLHAVIGRGDRFFCGVAQPDGSLETREIKVGSSNEENVVVLDGLHPGDSVAMRSLDVEKLLQLPEIPTTGSGKETPAEQRAATRPVASAGIAAKKVERARL